MHLAHRPGTRPAPLGGLRPLLLCAAVVAALCAAWLLPGHARAQTIGGAPVWPTIVLQTVADGYNHPVFVTNAGDDSGRLFVVEKAGYVTIIQNGVKLATPFLDIFSKVKSSCSECGLLSIAFPPDFATAGYFFVSYTARGNPARPVLPNEPSPSEGNDNVIARYRVLAGDPNRADPDSEERIYLVNQPYTNHNGGLILFGPDNMLYFGVGDGGMSGDPLNAAQNLISPLGKLLRIAVGATGTYTVPTDNPNLGAGALPEIWAYGVRNPWRFSFDAATGDFWLADVGQGNWEEVNFRPAAQVGGENYGWDITEGTHCYPPGSDPCTTTGFTLPIHEYDHNAGQSITGGFVYHGIYTGLQGIYVYGDFGSGKIWGLRNEGGTWQNHELLDAGFGIASFGVGEAGDLYVVDYGGSIRLITEPAAAFPETVLLPLVQTP